MLHFFAKVFPGIQVHQTHDLRVRQTTRLPSPNAIKDAYPMTPGSNATVVKGRRDIEAILDRRDPRLLVIAGPCSIHDPRSALEYASRLRSLAEQTRDALCVLMRVYFEKPRTTVGWKGLINDPYLDDSCDIEHGLRLARELLLEITALGLPAATEFVDSTTPQYIADLVSWAAIGARTTESQSHREMASGLSMPVGFKNSTDGDVQVAIDAMQSAMRQHRFLGIDQDGYSSIIATAGNPYGHVVLRGGRLKSNYDPQSIADVAAALAQRNLRQALIVDCSHANSGKKHQQQEFVWNSIIRQRTDNPGPIVGLMLESNLFEGNQPIPEDVRQLRYGVSVTDACVGWDTTERLLVEAAQTVPMG